MMVNLLAKMKEAAYTDQDLKQNKQPAIAKIKLLPAVVEQLSKYDSARVSAEVSIFNTTFRRSHLFDQFLDNDILDGIKLW
jgi:transcription factor SPN1